MKHFSCREALVRLLRLTELFYSGVSAALHIFWCLTHFLKSEEITMSNIKREKETGWRNSSKHDSKQKKYGALVLSASHSCCKGFSSFWFPYLRKEIVLLAYRTQGLQEVIDLDIQAAFESLEHY